ncbi:MAG: hypothetical protein Q9211_001112 [Gyalolechia sp. 1 TL-2023]
MATPAQSPTMSTPVQSATIPTPVQSASTTGTVDQQANAPEQTEYNSDDGVTQVSSPTESKHVRGCHLLEKIDNQSRHSSIYELSEEEDQINQRMDRYMAANKDKYGHPGHKATVKYRARVQQSIQKVDDLQRAPRTTTSPQQPQITTKTPEQLRRSENARNAGRISQQRRKERIAMGLPPTKPKRKNTDAPVAQPIAKAQKAFHTVVKEQALAVSTTHANEAKAKINELITGMENERMVAINEEEEIKKAYQRGHRAGYKKAIERLEEDLSESEDEDEDEDDEDE